MYATGVINNNGTISSTEASAGDVFIVSIGGWNYSQLFAIFANNGAEPKKRVIAQYGDSASSAFPVTANGSWGWTISNSTGYNHNYVIFRISK